MQKLLPVFLLVGFPAAAAGAAEIGETSQPLLDAVSTGAALIAPLLIAGGLIWIRSRRGTTPEVTFPDVAISVLPVLLALIVAGQVTEFTVGPEGVVVKALATASSNPVQTTEAFESRPIDPQQLVEATKGGARQIPMYLEQDVQALKFEIGKAYVPGIMEQYFDVLTQNPSFRYFVVLEPGGRRLYGIMDARRLLALTKRPRPESSRESNLMWDPVLTWTQVQNFIERNPKGFRQIRGFIPSEEAIRARDTRLDALVKLEKAGTEWLPVVDDEVRLVGITELSQLTAGLIRDVLDRLPSADQGKE